MKLKRFFTLVITLCMMLSITQLPVSAQQNFTLDSTISLSTYVESNFSYSTQSAVADAEGYTTYYVSLPSNPTFALSEYYANELNDYQKAMYRAFMDGICSIDADDLTLKHKILVPYSIEIEANVTTNQEFNDVIVSAFNADWENFLDGALYNSIQYDHTELFWVQGVGYQMYVEDANYSNGVVTAYVVAEMLVDASDLYASDAALVSAAKSMNSTVDSIITNAPTTSEYDMLVYFNDWLKQNNTYNHPHLENDNYPLAHSCISAFVSNNVEAVGPVCQGYAYALKYLCDIKGMNNVVVTGDLYQTYSDPGPHAWNAVELDGAWYAIDTTANDSLGTDRYNFLAGSTTSSHDSGYPTFSASHVNDTNHIYPTLSLTAYQYANPCTHTYDNACDAYCNICGDTREVPDHIYDNDCDTDCNECGETREVPDHVYDNDCDTDCNICGEARTITHKYDNACDADCNVCGTTRIVGNHVYDNDCDKKCNVCGATRTIAHSYDNDCDAICNVCGASRATTAIGVTPLRSTTEMEGHTMDKAVDGSDTTGFVTDEFVTVSGSPSGLAYVVFDLGTQQTIDTIKLKWGTGTWGYSTPDEYRVLVSADDITYNQVKHYVGLREIESGKTNTYPDVLTITGSIPNMKKATVNETGLNIENVRYIKVEIINWKNRAALTEIEVATAKELHTYDNDQDAECNECGFVREIITHIPGDVNGDGAVNNKDLGVLRRFLNDWDVTIDELASDVNDDGYVNNKDLGILRRYLNDWDVVLK